MAGAFSALTGWLLFAGLTLAIGASAARWVILARLEVVEGPTRHWLQRGAARVAAPAVLVLLIALGLFFARQLQEFRDPFAPWTEDARLLLGATAWGRTWLWAVAGTLLAAIGIFGARAGKAWGWWIATPVLLALGTFPAFTGHAAGEEGLRALALTADTMHVWASGAWMGGLAVVLYLDRSWRGESAGNESLLPDLVPRFSLVAMASVGTLAATGTFAAWLLLPEFGALFSTGYGRTLLIKLVLVAIVLGVGALNFRVLTPRLGSDAGNEAMRKAASVELLVAQAVLLVTAILVRLSPMDH